MDPLAAPKLNEPAGSDVGYALCRELPRPGANASSDARVPKSIELVPSESLVDRDGRTFIVGRDGREFEILDIEAVFNATKEFPVDAEHGTELQGRMFLHAQNDHAHGWIDPATLSRQEDGSIWADPEWNEEGERALRNRFYRYTSPGLNLRPGATIDDPPVVVSFRSVAMTNHPNLQTSALNSEASAQPTAPAAEVSNMKELAKALGLSPDASEAEMFAALNSEREAHKAKLVELNAKVEEASNVTPSLDQFVPRADFDAKVVELNALQEAEKTRAADLHKAEVDRVVGEAVDAGKITPATRDYYVANCSTAEGLESFKAFVAGAPVVKPSQTPPPPKPDGDGEVGLNSLPLTDEQKRLVDRMGVKPESFVAAWKARQGDK